MNVAFIKKRREFYIIRDEVNYFFLKRIFRGISLIEKKVILTAHLASFYNKTLKSY
jgi:hypothetical protein